MKEPGQPLVLLGVYETPPPTSETIVKSIPLTEAVPLIGLDSTRVLRQMSQLTRLQNAIESAILDLFE